MPFPEVKRVIYNRNPLDQVICQLRFPPILRIDAEVPAEFQDRVRSSFPAYSETSDWKIQLPSELEGQVPQEILNPIIGSSGTKNHAFVSENGKLKINLTRTFFALSTREYIKWEAFTETLAPQLSTFIDIYSPDFYTRIGLRYVNIICRSTLGLPDRPWSDLIQPHVLGILSVPEIGESVNQFEGKFELGLSDSERLVRIRTAFVKAADNEEICYKIDNDFFIGGKVPIDGADKKLDYLNARSGRLFRWSITDLLHNSMEPVEI